SDLRINSPSLYRLSYRGTAKKRDYEGIFRSVQAKGRAKIFCGAASQPSKTSDMISVFPDLHTQQDMSCLQMIGVGNKPGAANRENKTKHRF
ncbi:MAG: hypothetical protein REJ50_08640, partial [Bordetella sp.]|nr:hypothetical protein [Bordetella sp.]